VCANVMSCLDAVTFSYSDLTNVAARGCRVVCVSGASGMTW